jgi:hypothetical protein
MDGTRHNNYRLIPAIWASLAAPTALYAAPEPYPYVLSAGAVAQSFAAAGFYLNVAWAAHTLDATQPAILASDQ